LSKELSNEENQEPNQAICNTSDLNENGAREFELDGQSIIIINWLGNWHAYVNNCPHANWPLNIQPDVFFDSENQFLQCSNHMALFDIETGECKAGPCVGDRLTKVALEVKNSQIFAVLPPVKDLQS